MNTNKITTFWVKLINLSLIKTTNVKKNWNFFEFFFDNFFFSTKLIFSKTTVNPFRKKFQLFLKNNFFPQVPVLYKYQNNIRICVFHPKIVWNVFKRMLWTRLRVSLKKNRNFESFSVGQNLVVFQKKNTKNANFRYFFFDPTLFSPGKNFCYLLGEKK